ncbi:MAG: putative lipid II flippase FtsW, partial [Gammaproteobacteria bacterium]|nr:putative lipid II flippase FtsW [Gammaproteobacteria bacterium]
MTVLSSQAMRTSGEPRPFPVDPWLAGAWTALLGFGLVMVYSATVAAEGQSLSSHFGYLIQHTLHIGAGIALAILVSLSPIHWWERASKPLLGFGLALLVMVLIPGIGIEVNGSSRWLPVGPARVQPSELVKICMVVYAAGYLTRKREELGDFTQGVLMIGLVLTMVALLLLLEPDFGSFVVITLTVVGMLFLGGIRVWHFLLCLVLGGAAMVLLTIISPYRMARVTSFLHPWSDPYDSGFQLVQALIAFGRGDWHGVGLGASIQKLYYLPHANNDFLLAVIAEELGVVGVLAVVLLFGVVVWR